MMSESSKDRPFLCLSISAADSADDERLQNALVEIASGDPRIRVNSQPLKVSHRVEGQSKSQLDFVCDRLRDEYHLAINVTAPEPVLLETIHTCVEAEGKFIRQLGGMGNYGHCRLSIEPIKPVEGYVFASALGNGVLPAEYLNSIERGVQRAMQLGVHSGRYLVGLKVTVVDGSYHAEDSNPMAFEMAGMIALEHALRNAAPVVLEPVMAFDIDVPDAFAIVIEDEINQHRGRIDRMRNENERSEITAIVPLSELLASSSNGLAAYPMEFAGYEAVRDDDPLNENGSGARANKPDRPKPSRRSEMARPDLEDD
jgi:elongation factor G